MAAVEGYGIVQVVVGHGHIIGGGGFRGLGGQDNFPSMQVGRAILLNDATFFIGFHRFLLLLIGGGIEYPLALFVTVLLFHGGHYFLPRTLKIFRNWHKTFYLFPAAFGCVKTA